MNVLPTTTSLAMDADKDDMYQSTVDEDTRQLHTDQDVA
jgi:hypothetical protein